MHWTKQKKACFCFFTDGKQHKASKLDIITLRNHAPWSYMTWLLATWCVFDIIIVKTLKLRKGQRTKNRILVDLISKIWDSKNWKTEKLTVRLEIQKFNPTVRSVFLFFIIIAATRWCHRCWFRKFTVRFRPIRKGSMYDNNNLFIYTIIIDQHLKKCLI